MKRQKSKRKMLSLFFCLLLVVFCTACGRESKEEARAACEDFFRAYSSGDSWGMTEPMAEKLRFEINNVKSKGDEILVSTAVTAVDLQKVLESLPDTIDSTDAAREALAAAFSAEDVPVKEFEVEVSLVKEEEKWVVQMTPELADALLGGYYSILKEAAGEVTP